MKNVCTQTASVKKASSRPGLQGNCEDTFCINLVVLPVQIVVTFTSRKRAEDFIFFFQVASWAVSCSGIWSVVCMCSELNSLTLLIVRVFFISAGLWMGVGDKTGLVAIRCGRWDLPLHLEMRSIMKLLIKKCILNF